MFDAGQVRASLGADFKPTGFVAFDSAMKRSAKSTAAFERALAGSTRRSSAALGGMGRAAGITAVGGFAALGYGITKSAKAAMDYSSQMQTVIAVSGATAAQQKKLDVMFKQVGTSTKYSATEAAAGAVDLVKAGMSIEQVIGGGMKTALSLAAAGGIELADAATYTANAMNLFGIEAKDTGQIADALAQAANDTTADVSDFGMALTQGGSAAKTAGLEFKDTMVVLEALAKIGVKNSDAGTSMKAALIQMIKPTAKQAELQKELGISFIGNNGKMKDAVAISKELRSATEGKSHAERAAIFATLAGTDGMRVLNALYAAGPKTLAQYERALGAVGTAQRVAADRQEGFAGAVEKAEAAVKTSLVIIGEEFAPMLEKGAEGLSAFIQEAQADGSLKRFGEDLADAGEDFVEFGAAMFEMGQTAVQAGAPIVSVVSAIAGALNSLPTEAKAGALTGLLGGFLAFKAIGAMAPGIVATTGAIRGATAAAQAANRGANIANALGAGGFIAQTQKVNATTAGMKAGSKAMVGSLAAVGAAMGPVGMVAAGAGLAFAAYGMAQARAADQARDAASAIEAGNEAIRNSGEAASEGAAKVLKAEQDKASLQDLVSQRDAARRDGDKKRVEDLNRAIKQGKLTYEESAKASKEAIAAVPTDAAKAYGAALGKVNERNKDLQKAERERAQALMGVDVAQQASTQKAVEAANRKYQAAKREEMQLRALRDLAPLSQERMRAGSGGISGAQAVGVQKLQSLLKGMPKEVRTKILVEGDAQVLSKLGNVASSIKGKAMQAKVRAILEGDGSVRQKLKEINALANSQAEKKIKAIMEGDGTAKQKIAALKALKIANKNFDISAKDQATALINRIKAQQIADKFFGIFGINKGTKRARGRTSGSGEDALVGEAHPREAIVSGKTGEGFVTNGPMFMRLAPDDYVIPLDPSMGSRRNDLLTSLAADLGIPGFKKGKKGKGDSGSFPVPEKYRKVALAKPLDEMESKLSSARQRMKSAKKGSKKRRQAAEDVKTWERRVKEARKFDKSIKRQEDLLEIAEKDMTLGAKRRDRGLYNKGRDGRKSALARLRDWFTEAVDVAPNSSWGRELKKKLGDTLISIEGGGPQFKDEVLNVEDFITDPEQTRLDDLDAALAQAELTTGTIDDDRSALSQIRDVWEGIYGRVSASGAPSPVIADLARSVKSARDNLNNLSTDAAPDLQAQLDQANARRDAADKDAAANAAALRAFGGPGDIGSGGANAYGAAGGVTLIQNNQMLTPSDPQTLRNVAGAAVAGFEAQGVRRSPRVKTGV